jgi:hypothetical protein
MLSCGGEMKSRNKNSSESGGIPGLQCLQEDVIIVKSLKEEKEAAEKMTHSIKQIVLNLSEDELQQMLKGEYLRRLAKYKLTDELFRAKYGMTFADFELENMVAKKDFSWEVESDAQEWELSVDGIMTYQDKLSELQIEH